MSRWAWRDGPPSPWQQPSGPSGGRPYGRAAARPWSQQLYPPPMPAGGGGGGGVGLSEGCRPWRKPWTGSAGAWRTRRTWRTWTLADWRCPMSGLVRPSPGRPWPAPAWPAWGWFSEGDTAPRWAQLQRTQKRFGVKFWKSKVLQCNEK